MFRLSEIVKDWKESGALQAHINLYGFWDEETFLTKSGDLGMVLRVKGIDYESLDHASRDHAGYYCSTHVHCSSPSSCCAS